MIRRGVLVTAWLCVGHALVAGLYWLLLQVPESNAVMLGASVITILAMLAVAGVTNASALRAWLPATHARPALAGGLRGAAWVVPAMGVFVLFSLMATLIEGWLGTHGTEIDAWCIRTFGWTDAAPVHVVLGWTVWFIRYVFGTLAAVSLFSAGVLGGTNAVASRGWLTRAFGWRAFLVVTFALLVGIHLPWRYVVLWRPASLPVSWVQPAFAAVKLGLVFVVMNAAWAAVLHAAGLTPTPAAAPSASAPVAAPTAAPAAASESPVNGNGAGQAS